VYPTEQEDPFAGIFFYHGSADPMHSSSTSSKSFSKCRASTGFRAALFAGTVGV
jgi:hypothetical protein